MYYQTTTKKNAENRDRKSEISFQDEVNIKSIFIQLKICIYWKTCKWAHSQLLMEPIAITLIDEYYYRVRVRLGYLTW